MPVIVNILLHDIRSAHNVGSLLRTAECLGVKKVYLTGYTPYPKKVRDRRLPHQAQKTHQQISKTALGAEELIAWEQIDNPISVINLCRQTGHQIVALEQTPEAINLKDFSPPQKMLLIVGREVEGIDQAILDKADTVIQIPMVGQKESLNVVQATAIALYHCLK